MSCDNFPRCHDHALQREVHGHVSGLETDLKALEMHPHRVRWIREPSMGERVGCQQKTEIILSRGFRYRRDGQDQETQCASAYPANKNRELTPLCEPPESDLGLREETGTCAWETDCKRQGQQR